MKRIPLTLALTLLAACSQNPDGSTSLGMKGSPVWFASAPPEAIAAHFGASCQAYGYQPGTAEMTRCIHDSADAARVAELGAYRLNSEDYVMREQRSQRNAAQNGMTREAYEIFRQDLNYSCTIFTGQPAPMAACVREVAARHGIPL